MATTSIWRVKGWPGKVVIYAENPEKTANPKFYADRELTEQDGQQLSDVIRYAVNSEKTQETGSEDGAPLHRFVSGINCSPATARDEMLAVKKRFGKEDGTVAYHGYQSFAPGEATPELAPEIGVKLATGFGATAIRRLSPPTLTKKIICTITLSSTPYPLRTASSTTAPRKTITRCRRFPTSFAGNTDCR